MINLTQDAAGFIRMNRHFPSSSTITITYSAGASEVFSGTELNAIYDEALAEFRAQNHLDEKGFSRAPAKTVQPATGITFVPVQPGMIAR